MTKKNTFLLLILGTFFYCLVNFQRTAIPGSIFNELQASLGVPASSITALGASFMYVYAVCQLIIGLVVDRYGGFKTILMGGFFFAIGSFFFPWSHSLRTMYLLRAFTGLGASAIYLSMVRELRHCYPEKFTAMFGLFMFVGYAGTIVGGAPFVAAVQYCSWRFLLGSLGLLIAALYIAYATKYSSQVSPKASHTKWSLMPIIQVFQNPLNRWYSCFAWSGWGLYYTIQTVIGKKYLEDYCGMSAISATWILTAMGVLAAFTNICSGLCSRLAGNRRRPFVVGAAFASFVCHVLMCIALCCHFTHPGLSVLFFVLTVCANLSPITVALIQEMNSPALGGIAVAVNNAGSYLLVAVISNICGMLLECFAPQIVNGVRIYSAYSYFLFFVFAAILSGIGYRCVLHIPETGRRAHAA